MTVGRKADPFRQGRNLRSHRSRKARAGSGNGGQPEMAVPQGALRVFAGEAGGFVGVALAFVLCLLRIGAEETGHLYFWR